MALSYLLYRNNCYLNYDNEKEQFKILLEGNIKDGAKIEQKEDRDPLLLWEFWKKSSELFPKEIFNAKQPGINSVPHSVIFVFDGSSDEVILEEDRRFYKDLVNFSKIIILIRKHNKIDTFNHFFIEILIMEIDKM